MGLFRQKAIEHRRVDSLGTVIVIQPISHLLLLSVVACIFLMTVTGAAFGSYNRKATVNGHLVSSRGVVKVEPHASGMLKELAISPGDRVSHNQLLFVVSYEKTLEDGETLSAQQSLSLHSQRQLLLERKSAFADSQALRDNRLKAKVASLNNRLSRIDENAGIQKKRLKIARDQLENYAELKNRGFFSVVRFREQEDLVLSHRQAVTSLARTRIEIEDELFETIAAKESLPATGRERVAEIDQEIASIDRQLAEVNANDALEYRSPVAGLVTAVQTREGELVTPGRPAAVLLPAKSTIFARLYVPTSAAGFLSEGQIVKIRYAAFPYQRYGSHEGRIRHISKTILHPGEMSVTQASSTPSYQVDVDLIEQSLSAYGQSWQLRVGMELEADIVLDERTFLDWLLDPLNSIRGRIG